MTDPLPTRPEFQEAVDRVEPPIMCDRDDVERVLTDALPFIRRALASELRAEGATRKRRASGISSEGGYWYDAADHLVRPEVMG